MSHRKEQIESSLKRSIAAVISRHLADPRVRGLISITRVDVSPDLHQAQVFISVIPDKYESRTLAGLTAARGHILTKVGKFLRIRALPTLEFRIDESLKRQAEVFAAIREGMDREKPDADAQNENSPMPPSEQAPEDSELEE